MKYRVVVLRKAELQASEATIWWAENRSREQAWRWHENCEASLANLSERPERHSFAWENDYHPKILRQLLFGIGRKLTHRAIFYIELDIVYVISIRHLAQRNLTPEEL